MCQVVDFTDILMCYTVYYLSFDQIQTLTEEVGSSPISQWKRDNLRNELKDLKKKMDDMEKERKTAVIKEV